MKYRNLGRTGVKVSPLCLGTMNFGDKTDEHHAIEIIHHAIDAGINFIDTANAYTRGVSEQIVGKALKQKDCRDKIVLATKVYGPMSDDDPNMFGNQRRHIIEQCEASLRRLQTDWIDLYQIHRPQPEIPIDETLRALDDLIRAGKVRYIGTSTFPAWQVVESLWVSKELGLNRFVTEQPPYHMLDRRVERELLPMAQTYGIGVIPWSPLAGGFLTGKYTRNGERPKGARHQGNTHGMFTDAGFDIVERVTQLAKQKNCKESHLALAWCMHQPGVTSPIIGPRKLEQLEENLGALDVEITDADREAIDEVSLPGGALSDYYEADFRKKLHSVIV